jgi:hypothetical protein
MSFDDSDLSPRALTGLVRNLVRSLRNMGWLRFGGVVNHAAFRLGSAACRIVRMFTAASRISCLVPRVVASGWDSCGHPFLGFVLGQRWPCLWPRLCSLGPDCPLLVDLLACLLRSRAYEMWVIGQSTWRNKVMTLISLRHAECVAREEADRDKHLLPWESRAGKTLSCNVNQLRCCRCFPSSTQRRSIFNVDKLGV